MFTLLMIIAGILMVSFIILAVTGLVAILPGVVIIALLFGLDYFIFKLAFKSKK